MPLFKVSRTDQYDHDEYDAIIVRAETGERALACATARDEIEWKYCMRETAAFRGFRLDGSNLKVEEIGSSGETGLILGSFHAG
ncbi:hypothetical protein [Streptomyces sp. NPDC020141]|uniref:hypothetical protein n=1 Tax=Streptomyces sp. NPDC020141 TaxID=3365065 RepID=UPI00379A07DA